LTLVAFSGEQPVGSASLKIQEMDTHTHLIHWLGNVYVLPEYRNKGIGSALVRRSVEEATRLSVEDLYLHTPDQEKMYSRLAWTVIERTHYRGLDVVIMKRRLSAKPEN
jgi:predicted N-acetyltransferase YhbS